jgi:3-methylcrotonyl-CoA carboxylase alpha subunit
MGVRAGETGIEIDAAAAGAAGQWEFLFEDRRLRASGRWTPDGEIEATVGGRRIVAAVVPQGDKRHVFLDGRSIVLTHADPLGVAGAEHEEEGTGLLSPMPGKVIALLAKPGAAVEKGAPLLVLEAMKMEHTISAPHAGTVKSFRFAAGDQVEEGVALVEFE